MSARSADVLIAGAGPTGLFLACELHRLGRSCILVEQDAAPSSLSKALAIMPKTLDLFQRCGLAQPFLDALNPVRTLRFQTPHRRAQISFAGMATAYPFVGILPQWKTQALLAARLSALGGAVCYGARLTGLHQLDEGVTGRIETATETYEIRASYAAGCDGARSSVRSLAGIAFDGLSYPQNALLADAQVSTDVPLDEAVVHVDRNGLLTLFPLSPDVRRVVVAAQDTATSDVARAIRDHLEHSAPGLARIRKVYWAGSFRVHRRIAARLRAGRILIAGDAAHLQSPVGGQGMNTGLHDAAALARALHAALAGDAAALDVYGRERLDEAGRVVRRTDALTRALAHPNAAMRIGREYFAPAIVQIPAVRDRIVRSLLTA